MVRVAALGLALAVAAAPAAEFTVDAGQVGRPVFPLGGVNAGPGHMKDQPGLNLTNAYREMGISMVRAADYYGPCDLSALFPSFYDGWDADPADPANYDFAETDATIAEIEQASCEIMFRLGESWYKDDAHNEIPPDFEAVAEVCEHIAEHYGAGQAGPYGARIRLWEIWNEPNHPMFWNQMGDRGYRKFFTMYALIARRLKTKFPWIKVGGPGAKGNTDEGMRQFTARFAAACRDKAAPLDFYSWHSYNRDHHGPHAYARQARIVRETLNAAGFGKTLNVLGEWNTVHFRGTEPVSAEEARWQNTLWNAEGAAFTAAALICMHLQSDLRYAFRYRGDIHTGETGYGLVNPDGSIKKPGYALKAYSGLFPGSRQMRLLSATGGDAERDDSFRAVMATTDRGRTVINVLVALWGCAGEGFTLTINDLPQTWTEPRLEHYVVNPRADYAPVEEKDLRTLKPLTYQVQGEPRIGSAVHLVRVYDASRFPVLQPGEPRPATLP